jgi:alpha-glucosidase (family GH31 glycosyl hydrolase)
LRKGARRRRVYLPSGGWYDFWTNRRVEGGRNLVADAPLERIPLFVRAGSVVPLAGGELRVFPGEGVSWLYEDDGETTAARSCATRLEVAGAHVTLIHNGTYPSAFSA